MAHSSCILSQGRPQDVQCGRGHARAALNQEEHSSVQSALWEASAAPFTLLERHAIGWSNEKGRGAIQSFLHWFSCRKQFPEVDVRSSRFGVHLDELDELTWAFVTRISDLKNLKIKCPIVWPVKLFASADGTQAPTNEPRDADVRRNPKNFSHKCNISGLNYQIVLCLWENKVLCINDGDPGSVHDMTAIRQEFMAMVPAGCRVVADSGFTGKTEAEKKAFAVKNNLDDDEVGFFKGKAKARHETFNKRIKDYHCLQVKFRHGVEKHRLCFRAVVVLCQCAIEDTSVVGEPLMTL